MPRVELLDLHASSTTQNSDTKLANRRDSAVDGVFATAEEPKRVIGLMARCSDAGYLLALLEGENVLTADLATLNALTEWTPVDIEVPANHQLTFYCHNTAGTAACTVTLRVEVGT